MLRIIKQFITKLIKDHQQRRFFKLYNRQWLRYMKEHGFENKPAAGEEQYMSFWRLLSKYVSPLDYRYFSHFKPERGGGNFNTREYRTHNYRGDT